MLIRELVKEDNFITVEIYGKEYVIEKMVHKKNHTDPPLTHLCLVCRDGGNGEVRR